MDPQEVLAQLEALGSLPYKKILLKHGAVEPVWGVKIEELKKVQKRAKTNHALALALFDSGVYDAMYLAGLIADDPKMSVADLERWRAGANCPALREYTVAWVTAGSLVGWEAAQRWIEASDEGTASCGWAALGSLVALKADAELDVAKLGKMLSRIPRELEKMPPRVRYTMNGFVIAAGSYVEALTERALSAAAAMGPVSVVVEGTACKVPAAADYIAKAQQRGTVGKKKKTVKC